jgi:uncharacterized protein (DUF2062 family)
MLPMTPISSTVSNPITIPPVYRRKYGINPLKSFLGGAGRTFA